MTFRHDRLPGASTHIRLIRFRRLSKIEAQGDADAIVPDCKIIILDLKNLDKEICA